MLQFLKVSSYEEMSKTAAEKIAEVVKAKPESVLGLATGSSPVGTYDELVRMEAAGEISFAKARSVNLDEYLGLDGTHDQSYRYFMDTHLFKRLKTPFASTAVPCGTAADMGAECKRYDQLIADLGGTDLQLLGIGPDGHIGFNEPGDAFILETHVVDLDPSTIEANARFFASQAEVPRRAVTMGMGGILGAKKILLVASGKAKEDVLKEAVFGPVTPRLPASILQNHPDVTVVYSAT